jgi:hypothetical protein
VPQHPDNRVLAFGRDAPGSIVAHPIPELIVERVQPRLAHGGGMYHGVLVEEQFDGFGMLGRKTEHPAQALLLLVPKLSVWIHLICSPLRYVYLLLHEMSPKKIPPVCQIYFTTFYNLHWNLSG